MIPVFEKVDALLARSSALPPPHVRRRLRQADGLTQDEVARVCGVKRLAVIRWEQGRTEPRRPHRDAYVYLLQALARKHPAATTDDGEGGGMRATAPRGP